MVLSKILLFLAFGGSYYQRVRDGNHIHELYRNRHDKVIGGYEQLARHDLFAAQCLNQPTVALLSEKDGRRYVESCPDPAVAAVPSASKPSPRLFTIDLGFTAADGPIKGFSK